MRVRTRLLPAMVQHRMMTATASWATGNYFFDFFDNLSCIQIDWMYDQFASESFFSSFKKLLYCIARSYCIEHTMFE